jgi:hypothetical protein
VANRGLADRVGWTACSPALLQVGLHTCARLRRAASERSHWSCVHPERSCVVLRTRGRAGGCPGTCPGTRPRIVVPDWSQSAPRMVAKCAQDGPKGSLDGPKGSQYVPKVVTGWPGSAPRTVQKWSQDGPKVHRPAPLSPQHFRALQGTLGHFRAL